MLALLWLYDQIESGKVSFRKAGPAIRLCVRVIPEMVPNTREE